MFSAKLEQLFLFIKTSPIVKEAAAFAVLALLASPVVVIFLLVVCTLVRYIRRKYFWGE